MDYYCALTYDRRGIGGDSVIPTIKLQDGSNIMLHEIGATRSVSFCVKRKTVTYGLLRNVDARAVHEDMGTELERIWKDRIIDCFKFAGEY